MMADFFRGTYSTIWITLRSDEPLGFLDSSYLEDFDGIDGYISIYHPATLQRWSIPMVDLPTETPLTPHDVFRGGIALSSLPDGGFEIQGRVRDTAGNYKIIGAVSSPIGGEGVQSLTFKIVAGLGVILELCPLRIDYGLTFEALGVVSFDTEITGFDLSPMQTLGIASGDCC
jgi:hypothetical protein